MDTALGREGKEKSWNSGLEQETLGLEGDKGGGENGVFHFGGKKQ